MSLVERVDYHAAWIQEELRKDLYTSTHSNPDPYIYWVIGGHYRNLRDFDNSASSYAQFVLKAPDTALYAPYKIHAKDLITRLTLDQLATPR